MYGLFVAAFREAAEQLKSFELLALLGSQNRLEPISGNETRRTSFDDDLVQGRARPQEKAGLPRPDRDLHQGASTATGWGS
jgi:hypothetical protein